MKYFKDEQITLNDTWFVNLTNKDIPRQVSELLQFGERFTLPIRHDIKKVVLETIKNVESNIYHFDLLNKANIRNHTYTYLDNFIKQRIPMTQLEKNLLAKANIVKKFIKHNPDILFTRADKGNITVAILKNDYITKILDMLNDHNTYIMINKNPLRLIESKLKDLLNR